MHRERDRAQHLPVQPGEIGPHPRDVPRRARDQQRGARRRRRHRRAGPGQDRRLRLDLGPGVVIGLGRDRLAGGHAAAVAPLAPAGGRVVGRRRGGIALPARERVDAEHPRLAPHDLDAVPVMAPGVAGSPGPGVQQRIERPGPDAAVGREPVDAREAARGRGAVAAGRGTGEADAEPGRSLDTPRQHPGIADVAERQGHGIGLQQVRRQPCPGLFCLPHQAEPGAALDHPDRRIAGTLRFRLQRCDSLRRIPGLGPRRVPQPRPAARQQHGAEEGGGEPCRRARRSETGRPESRETVVRPFEKSCCRHRRKSSLRSGRGRRKAPENQPVNGYKPMHAMG